MTFVRPSLVSVVIPVYNRASMLREAVASALAQTYRPIEIVIVDDASTDETAAVADDMALQHDGIVRVIHQPNAGVGHAREAGRQAAEGEFIQYLDSDDRLLPRKLELQVAALRAHPECGIAYGLTRYIDSSGREVPCDWKHANQIQSAIFPSFLLARWWETVSPLYRRSVTDAAGPWTGLRLEEDWEYDCRVGALGVSLCYIGEIFGEHRDHPEGRLSRGAGDDPARLRDRACAHELIAAHARRAGVDPRSPEFRQFARELFHLGRQCGAAGLDDESRRLVALARSLSGAPDVRAYELLARTLGWRRAGRAAAWLERHR
jgi:hypothetical protein